MPKYSIVWWYKIICAKTKNGKAGDSDQHGAVRDRSQTFNPRNVNFIFSKNYF